jgi:hypothetical protein
MGREVYTGFWWGNVRERDQLEDLGVDGRIILRWIYRKWTDLTQDRDRWRALVDALTKLRVPLNVRNFLTRLRTVSFSGRYLLRAVS